jgi:hypothetical protein
VRFNGRAFEAVVARLEERPTKDIYHSALRDEQFHLEPLVGRDL